LIVRVASESRFDPMDPNSTRKDVGSAAKQFAIAMQIPFSLVVPIFVGGGIGYLLDRWLHTKFIFMIVLGIAGFGIGLREVLQLASAADKKNE
jgi:F0F1-type ATP synthase assembly protein I